jgi:antitoxin ParD1/3/4
MSRASRTLTITLGDLDRNVRERVKSGAYSSASEVLRAAVRALDREEAAIDQWLQQQVEEAFADPRPNIPAREVFRRLRKRHALQVKSKRGEKI